MRNHLSSLSIVAVLLAGCASSTPPATVVVAPPPAAPAPAAPAAPAPPPAAPAAPVQTAPGELPPGPGREAVLKGCGGCHGIGQILPERRSRAEWSDTVTMMITNGAPVAEADFDAVVTYLATHFGPR